MISLSRSLAALKEKCHTEYSVWIRIGYKDPSRKLIQDFCYLDYNFRIRRERIHADAIYEAILEEENMENLHELLKREGFIEDVLYDELSDRPYEPDGNAYFNGLIWGFGCKKSKTTGREYEGFISLVKHIVH